MNLTKKILFALVLGTIAGLAFNLGGAAAAFPKGYEFLVNGFFGVVGTVFINALKMLVVPLVIFSLIPGVVGIGDIRALGRVGCKSFALYMGTTAIAISSALFLAASFQIGEGMTVPADSLQPAAQQDYETSEAPPISEMLVSIVPDNPIEAMANAEMLAVIFFSILFGISLLMVKESASTLIKFSEQMNLTMMKMVEIVMHFSPIAVFCLIAKSISESGIDLLLEPPSIWMEPP